MAAAWSPVYLGALWGAEERHRISQRRETQGVSNRAHRPLASRVQYRGKNPNPFPQRLPGPENRHQPPHSPQPPHTGSSGLGRPGTASEPPALGKSPWASISGLAPSSPAAELPGRRWGPAGAGGPPRPRPPPRCSCGGGSSPARPQAGSAPQAEEAAAARPARDYSRERRDSVGPAAKPPAQDPSSPPHPGEESPLQPRRLGPAQFSPRPSPGSLHAPRAKTLGFPGSATSPQPPPRSQLPRALGTGARPPRAGLRTRNKRSETRTKPGVAPGC